MWGHVRLIKSYSRCTDRWTDGQYPPSATTLVQAREHWKAGKKDTYPRACSHYRGFWAACCNCSIGTYCNILPIITIWTTYQNMNESYTGFIVSRHFHIIVLQEISLNVINPDGYSNDVLRQFWVSELPVSFHGTCYMIHYCHWPWGASILLKKTTCNEIID